MPSVEIQAAENILNRCHSLFTLRGEYRENTAPLVRVTPSLERILYSSGLAYRHDANSKDGHIFDIHSYRLECNHWQVVGLQRDALQGA